MFCHKCKCCKPMWFSGFFGLAAFAHIIRLVARAQVQIGGVLIPMKVSIGIVVVAAILSFVFCKMSSKACNCGTK